MTTQTTAAVVVAVPEDENMAGEPAVTIGEIFQDKTMIKTYVAAALSLLAYVTGWVADGEVIENVTTLISGAGLLVTALMAQYEARQRARAQAAKTRDAVYSPATAAAIATASKADVVPGDPRYASPAIGVGGRRPTGRV